MTHLVGQRHLAFGASALAVLSVLSAGCGRSHSAPQPTAGGELTLYSAQHEQTTKALVEAFTKDSGIKVKVVPLDEGAAVAKIEQEGDKSPADLVYTENSPWLAQLDSKGLLGKVDDGTLGLVPKGDSAASGNWVAVSARVTGVTYNPDKVPADQLPHSVLDLAGPQWKDKIELAPTETDFWPVVSSVLHAKGKDATLAWLNGLKANAGANAAVPSNENLAADINQGNAALGVLNSYYFYRLKTEVGASSVKSQFAYFAPHDPGYVKDISGAAVLKSSKNQAAAQKFLAFLTGKSGQTIIATSDSFEYPLAVGVAANSQLPPMDTLAPNDFSVTDMGTCEDAEALLQEAQLL
ncbi:extracellular solute-binding protein [Mycolicibacterium sarraceniae]|uniref:extracellular solute-binding protein n=1 Tax=Mycolicibacterium sarraceniae TaxID=1534348 RepID=UPI001C658D60|nr:extracellular solute-binding protein [Mycolicibacterium sarraceniae]